MYSSFHHLRPELAQLTIQNAVKENQPIVVFEGIERSVKGLLACLFIPLMVFVVTPFVRPFSFVRLLFTYIVPVLPIVIFFDGLVSSLRTYSVDEIESMTEDMTEFNWDARILIGPRGERIFSLVGLPKK